MAEQWLSIVEYARTFAVSDMTVRRRIKNGKLRAVLREGKYYIPLGESGGILDEDQMIEAPVAAKAAPMASLPGRQVALGETHSSSYTLLGDERGAEEALPNRFGASTKALPNQMIQNLQRNDSTLVDSHALLQFCEQSMTRISSIERHLQDSFQQRLQNLETQIKLKDGIIVQLRQQVEDLQMLVKLMEQR